MLGFAWSILVLDAIILIAVIIVAFLVRLEVRMLLSSIFVFTIEILGCLLYIFRFSVLPYDFIIGMALGVTVLVLISAISSLLVYKIVEKSFFTWFYLVVSCVSFVFFTLAAVQHIWPHLITF